MGDFGISRVLQFTQDLAQTAVGTPLYVAPEVVKGVGYDAKADVWSMGCTFYEILTLSPPFSGMSLSDLMIKVRTANYQRISNRFEWVQCEWLMHSPELKELIESMIVVDPKYMPKGELTRRQRPSIEDILMKPCCMERLHRLYPQYIPTLFPYSAPVLNPLQPSQPSIHSARVSVASSQQSASSRRSYYTRLSVISSPSRAPLATPMVTPMATPMVTPMATPMVTPMATPMVTPMVTPMATPMATPMVTPVTSNPSSGKQSKPRSSHSSHSIVPQRIVSMTSSSSKHSIFSSDAEVEVLPRRFSFPVQSIDSGTRPTSPTKGTLYVMETVEEKPCSVASVTPNEVMKKPKHPKYAITPTRIESGASASLLPSTHVPPPPVTPPVPSPSKEEVCMIEKRKGSVKPLKEELISSVPIPKPLPIPATVKRTIDPPLSVPSPSKEEEHRMETPKENEPKRETEANATKQPKTRRRKERVLFDPWHTPTTHEIDEHNNALRKLRHKGNM